MHWGSGWGWGDWLAMSLMMVVFWGLLIAGIVYLVRTVGRPRDERPDAENRAPGRILDERYARGEIDEEEFKRRRETLSTPT